ncbi:DNA methyltransferase 1-associated protein 1 [Arachnomyces sp. PD_36]|nr:DNA methyltransferase 1-associated protein 1 [Arachnomyces sp. PD_36]
MAAADVRDMLDLPADGQSSRPHKKQKVIEKRPEGITRELYALLGERAPPIAINENKYKGRPKWMSKIKVRPWQMAPFTNQARNDGLVLHHWQRKTDASNAAPPNDGTEMEVDGQKESDEPKAKEEPPYTFAKFNVKAQVPKRYTDEQYDRYLRNDNWTREETDYLMDLVEEFDLRWVVIYDRYDYQPASNDTSDNSTALVTASQRRTMEQMKSRYYTVAANMLALEHPPSEMSEAEFDLHEKMTKFNPDQETSRKELAALQLKRSVDEVNEETILLEELKRIIANEANFVAERKELYARLEAPISTGNTGVFQSSSGLSQLLSNLLQSDKNKKRRSLLGPEAGAASPVSQAPQTNAPTSRADTPTGPSGPSTTNNKKGSNAAASNKDPNPAIRTLTPAEEIKYGVSRIERVPSGVQFRNDKAQKLTQAKSNIQSQKLAAALTELEIPPRLVMPTERTCKEFEKLIVSVNLLLDARKVAEKVEGEIRVLEAGKEERERKEKEATMEKEKAELNTEEGADASAQQQGGEAKAEASAPAAEQAAEGDKTQEAAATEAGEGAAEGAENPAEPTQPSTKESAAAHKRSASVLSAISDKSTKKQRKAGS